MRPPMTSADNLEISYLKDKDFTGMMFGQKIAYIIEINGLSKAWIADRLGISKQALNYLLKHSIKPKFIDELSELLKLDPKWLETGVGYPQIKATTAKLANIATIPIATKLELLDNTAITKQHGETIEFACKNLETLIAYKLENDSNFPPFIKGSILIFDTKKRPKSGDYVLFITNKDVFVRQYLVDGKNICYKASNSEHKTFINPKVSPLLGVLIEARYKIN